MRLSYKEIMHKVKASYVKLFYPSTLPHCPYLFTLTEPDTWISNLEGWGHYMVEKEKTAMYFTARASPCHRDKVEAEKRLKIELS